MDLKNQQVKLVVGVFQTVIYLFLFLIVSYLSSYLDLTENSQHETTFQSKFEKYLVLAIGLYMAIPFTLSNLLILGIIQKNHEILKTWFKLSIGTSAFLFLVALGSAIFIVVKGTGYVGYTLIGFSLAFGGFSGFYTYIGWKISKDLEEFTSNESSPQNSNRSSIEEDSNKKQDV